MQVTVADIVQNLVQVVLNGSYSGVLDVRAVGQSGGETISKLLSSDARRPGTYDFSFQDADLPPAEYTKVEATWEVEGGKHGEKSVAFRVLGSYRDSQYNTPHDVGCAGDLFPTEVAWEDCSVIEDAWSPYDFLFQVGMNGSGVMIAYDKVQLPWGCWSSANRFKQVSVITGAAGYPLSELTVAARPGHPDLALRDPVKIVGIGVKRVWDICPRCAVDQLDNYSDSEKCSPAEVGDLRPGPIPTIRLQR